MRELPRVYRSFEEFEREELRSLSRLHVSVDEMMDEAFCQELDFDPDFVAARSRREESEEERSRRRRPRRRSVHPSATVSPSAGTWPSTPAAASAWRSASAAAGSPCTMKKRAGPERARIADEVPLVGVGREGREHRDPGVELVLEPEDLDLAAAARPAAARACAPPGSRR